MRLYDTFVRGGFCILGYDTIRLRSIPLDDELAKNIEKEVIRREGVDMKTGEILYRITAGQLEGSYDSRLSLQVKNQEWIRDELTGKTRLKNCLPYLSIECSIHKILAGHNCWGAPNDFQLCVYYMIDFVKKALNIDLPMWDTWRVERVDYAKTFLLPSSNAIEEYFRALELLEFSRRTINRYGYHSLHIGGTTTTVKFYHKGVEFQKNDRKRLRSQGVETQKLFEIQNKANHILRVEVGIKDRKLRYDFESKGGKRGVYADMITDDYVQAVWEKEINRLVKEVFTENELIRDSDKVFDRLKTYFMDKPRTAKSVYDTWIKLKTLGESKTKSMMSKPTYYRHVNFLKELGCSWLDDLDLNNYGELPHDFTPTNNKYELVCELLEVWKNMKWYRQNVDLKKEHSREIWRENKKRTMQQGMA